MTTNKSVLAWIDEMKELVQPDKLVWIDGSEEQLEALRAEACSTGEMHKLNQEKLPGCYLHRTAVNDVARVEDRTMICSKKEEDAGPTNHWMDPEKAYKMLYDIARGSYKGRSLDNTDEGHVEAWLSALERIRPEGVTIYTVDRDTPAPGLSKAPRETLDAIAQRVRALGFPCTVGY